MSWVLYGLVERERYGAPEKDGSTLERLRRAAPLAAEFPAKQPTVFLFDFRDLRKDPSVRELP